MLPWKRESPFPEDDLTLLGTSGYLGGGKEVQLLVEYHFNGISWGKLVRGNISWQLVFRQGWFAGDKKKKKKGLGGKKSIK